MYVSFLHMCIFSSIPAVVESLRLYDLCLTFQWIMDVLVCNGLGIYYGMKTLAWLSMKPYQWQGLWNIPTYKYDNYLLNWPDFNSFINNSHTDTYYI